MPATPLPLHAAAHADTWVPARRTVACRWLAAVGLGLVGLLAAGTAPAAVTVLLGDSLPAHAEFARALHDGTEAGAARVEIARLGASGAVEPVDAAELPASTPIAAAAVPADEDRSVVAGVRTRSLRSLAGPAQAEAAVTVAVGVAASRSAIERPSPAPLLLAMLSQLEYEALRSHPGLRRSDRRVGVLLRDPAMADQLVLIDAVLPQKRRLGVVATVESEPLLRELQRAATGWDLQVQYAPDPTALATALRTVVLVSDALLVLPDLIGDNQAATLAVLRAAAGAGLPVFGASDGLVRSGGLAAAVSTPQQLALQARALCERLAAGGSGAGSSAWVEPASPATVRVNLQVARGLGLRLPDERTLGRRIAAAR